MFYIGKRHLTYIALTFPALVYLFLMFSVIGQVCIKTETDQGKSRAEFVNLNEKFDGKLGNRNTGSSEVFHDFIDSRRLLNAGDSKSTLSSEAKSHRSADVRPKLIFNCSSISKMKIRNKIGHGVSKQAFVADYQGMQVAIKMVTRHIHELRTCLEQLRQLKLAQEIMSNKQDRQVVRTLYAKNDDKVNVNAHFGNSSQIPSSQSMRSKSSASASNAAPLPTVKISNSERQRCYTFPTARLMKEILLSEQLNHQNLVKMLGYCVRSEESDSTDISEHGVVSVFELGSHFVLDNLQILPWQARLQHALDMADLLNYLEHSPLGSLIVPDFKEGHLLMVNGSLKLIDLDDVNNLEPECDPHQPQTGQCPYNLRCVRALCEGFNAKENLKNMNILVLKRLLFPLSFPESIVPQIGQLNAQLDTLSLTADELKAQLIAIRALVEK